MASVFKVAKALNEVVFDDDVDLDVQLKLLTPDGQEFLVHDEVELETNTETGEVIAWIKGVEE